MTDEEVMAIVDAFMVNATSRKRTQLIEENAVFLEANKAKEGVVTTASGLQYKVIKSGTGKMPAATDKVTVHYTGQLINGTVFDSTVSRNEPATFQVDGVIDGWTEALQLMHEGDKWMLYIPFPLAYGERGAGNQIPPFSTLIFELELIKVN
jgi:FKBP-type peptidyl-prolyl cis-trans isomerase FklB